MAPWKEYKRTYLDPAFKPTSWSVILPILTELHVRELPDLASLQKWLEDWSEVEDALSEAGVWYEIVKDQRIDDVVARDRYLSWKEQIEPNIRQWSNKLQRKLVNHPRVGALGSHCREFLKRSGNQTAIFRVPNAELQAQCDALVADYFKVRGAQSATCQWSNPDRSVRESTYRGMTESRAQSYDAVDRILDELLSKRHRMGNNAGCCDFRAFRWLELNRFDYTPEDCLGMVDAVEKVVVPYLREIDCRRANALGVRKLRPWDVRATDETGSIKLFDSMEDLLTGIREVLNLICRAWTPFFDGMVHHNLLDLEQRPGKAHFVGYCQFLKERRTGYVFKNVKPVRRDIETVFHELGHALHVLACRDLPLTWNRQIPPEFSEVVANCLQILAGSLWEGTFFDPANARRARVAQLEDIVDNLVYTARGEAFLHWLHTNPSHTSTQRQETWFELNRRIGHDVDWSGIENHCAYTWIQEIPHLFFSPFYWIEYLFGQVGALQLWRNYVLRPERTVDMLRTAMKMGNSSPTQRLFQVAGISFSINPVNLTELVRAIDDEIGRLR